MIGDRFPYMTLRLFILRIGKRTAHPVYRIAYGVAYPTHDSMSETNVSQFNELGTFNGRKYYVAIATIAYESTRIIGLYNDLGAGLSLHQALTHWGIAPSVFDFDVKYHHSPVYNMSWNNEEIVSQQVTYSKVVCMTPVDELAECGKDEQHKFVKATASHLAQKTGLPCKELMNRIGNLEILLNLDRDIYGKSLVNCHTDKESPYCVHIILLPDLTEHCDTVSVNVRIHTDGNIIYDTLQSKTPVAGKETVLDFHTQHLIRTYEVKVWIGKQDENILVHRAKYCLLRQISLNMEIVRQHIHISHEWLDKIRETLPEKRQGMVDNAATIRHSSIEQHTIGLSRTNTLNDKEDKIKPRFKTNDRYFPQGWNKDTEEQGALGFLAWFQEQAQNANRIFIQDPYFEDVALLFLASSNINCEYTILTQTRLKTNTDGTDRIQQNDETLLRRLKIINIIKNYPTLFRPLKLIIKDIAASGPKLHDRYLMFVYPDKHIEGYALSNSFQGATTKLPLLVTQIGDCALQQVLQHIMDIYTVNHTETIYDYNQKEDTPTRLNNEIADKGFYDWWNKQQLACIYRSLHEILDDIFRWNTMNKLSTAGYCLANLPDKHVYKVLNAAAELLRSDRNRINILKDFILDRHYSDFPVGFINCPDRPSYHPDFSGLLGLPYHAIVTTENVNHIEDSYHETDTHRVWGQYFACRILIMISPEDAIDVLKQLQRTLTGIHHDKTITPVYKVTHMLLTAILSSAILEHNDKLMTTMLTDAEEWCHGLGALIFLNQARQENFHPTLYRHLFNHDNEFCIFCHSALELKPEVNDKHVFYQWLTETFTRLNNSSLIIDNLEAIIKKAYFQDDVEKYIEQVIIPLISDGIIDRNETSRILIRDLFDTCISPTSCNRLQTNLPVALSLINGDISPLITQAETIIRNYNRSYKAQVIITPDAIFQISVPIIGLNKLLKKLLTLQNDHIKSSISRLQEMQQSIATHLKRIDCGQNPQYPS